MRAILHIAAALTTLISLWSSASANDQSQPGLPVPLLRLIASPERYDGREVVVVGVFISRAEETSLYLTSEHARNFIQPNSLALFLDASSKIPSGGPEAVEKLSGRYVVVSGKFEAGRPGGRGEVHVQNLEPIAWAVSLEDEPFRLPQQ